jgi:hypothetical protein
MKNGGFFLLTSLFLVLTFEHSIFFWQKSSRALRLRSPLFAANVYQLPLQKAQ